MFEERDQPQVLHRVSNSDSRSFFSLTYYFVIGLINCFSVLCACMSVYHMHACPGRPEEGIEHLELESYLAVSCHVGAGTQTLVLWKSNQCSQPLSCWDHLESWPPAALPC